MAELVKIDPKAIGVGQYQHDMNQKKLNEALSGVVEDCVNRVGCGSEYGIGAASFLYFRNFRHDRKNIVAYREETGSLQTEKCF